MRSQKRLTRRSRSAAALVALGLATALAACSGSGSAGTNEEGGADSFTFAIGTSLTSLDIPKNFGADSMLAASLVTEKLETISMTGEVQPNLATEVEQPDDTTLIYKIRDGVRFSDGTPLTAEDVAWSMQHVTDPEVGHTASIVTSVDSIEATGPLEVTVKLKYGDPVARSGLAVITFVQQQANAEASGEDLGTAAAPPIGTGPYTVQSLTTERLVLTRNGDYWGEKPVVETVNIDTITDENTGRLAMRSGEIDGSFARDLKTLDQWTGIDGVEAYSFDALEVSFLTLDTSTAPFSDIHVRRAISHAIDREGVLQAAYGENAVLLDGMVRPAMLAGITDLSDAESFLAGLPQPEFDLDAAKAELAQSEFGEGLSFELPYRTDLPAAKMTAENLKQNLETLGVEVRITPVSVNEWRTKILSNEDLGAQINAITPAVPDINQILTRTVGTASMGPGKINTANYTTPEVDAAIDVLQTSTDDVTRWQASQTILGSIAEDMPYVPLFGPNTVVVLGNGFAFSEQPDLFDVLLNGTWVFAVAA